MARRVDGVVLRPLLLLAAMAALTLAGYRMGYHRLLLDRGALAEWIASFRSGPGVLVFIAVQALQVLFAPVPGEVTGFVGGFLYGGVRGLLYSSIGLSLGSLGAFGLGRLFGRPLVERIARAETLERYDFLVAERGVWMTLLLFLVPGFPKDLLCYVLGTSRMAPGAFFAVSTVGRVLGTAMLSMSGQLARGGEFRLLGLIAALAAAAVLVSFLYRDRWLQRLRERGRGEGRGDTEGPAGPDGTC